eukprot:scaffold290148_cov20-Prasinocladus_malaysianus.AAC.1
MPSSNHIIHNDLNLAMDQANDCLYDVSDVPALRVVRLVRKRGGHRPVIWEPWIAHTGLEPLRGRVFTAAVPESDGRSFVRGQRRCL